MIPDGPIVEAQPVEVWPEHWQSMEVFAAMGSQVNVAGMGGVIGYRYEALPVVLECLGIAPADRREVFLNFRTLEVEAVRLLNERRNG